MPAFDPKYVIKSDNVIPEDEAQNLLVANAGWTSGAITRGEWRTRNGLQKLGTPADDEIQESFTVTMRNVNESPGNAPKETAEDQQSGDDNAKPGTIVQDSPDVALDEPLPPRPDEQVPVNGTPGLTPEKAMKRKAFTPAQRVKAWQRFDKAATASEGPYKKAVTKIADKQQKEFDSAFNSALESGSSSETALSTATAQVFGEAADKSVQKALYASWMTSMHGGLTIANSHVDTDIAFSVMQPVFRAWIDDHGLEKSKYINDTTRDGLAKSLGDGIEAGESILDLQKRIEDQYDELRGYRSEAIARTESAGSMNFGSTATYKSAGVSQKSWLGVQDDREREAHLEVEGQIVGIDEPFSVDGEDLQYPGDPSGSAENVINCRCSILPEFGDQGE
jgi:hypothetical protein